MTTDLLLHMEGGIARLVLNRPDKHNAITRAMWQALPALIDRVEQDREVLALLVTGAGDRAFCAGADIAEFAEIHATPDRSRAWEAEVRAGFRALERLSKPSIALVRGLCVGGGCGLALNCDLRFVAAGARFGITPARLGLVYGFEDTKRLVDTVGPARAKDILFSGRLIGAEEALAIGLVDRVFPTDRLEPETLAYLDTLCANSQYTIRAAKAIIQSIQDGADSPPAPLRRLAEEAVAAEDFREGCAAFLAKRRPGFGFR